MKQVSKFAADTNPLKNFWRTKILPVKGFSYIRCAPVNMVVSDHEFENFLGVKGLGRFSGFGSWAMKGIQYLLRDTGIGHAGSHDGDSSGTSQMGMLLWLAWREKRTRQLILRSVYYR
jgi:hypothetical protein